MISSISEKGKDKIITDSIDNILKNDFVTIIKMDIEGYEKEDLKGAKKLYVSANKCYSLVHITKEKIYL